jgi:hypothetical protein
MDHERSTKTEEGQNATDKARRGAPGFLFLPGYTMPPARATRNL